MDFRRSKTYDNLQIAFDRELKSSTIYKIYGLKARKDGYIQIGNIYDETSRNEREHAQIWLKLLKCGKIPSTYENLKDSYTGENEEAPQRYLDFADVARGEGYVEIANLFDGVANIEKNHEERFRKFAKNIKTDTVFCKNTKVVWICSNCGHVVYGECAPHKCPVCGYPQAYFEIKADDD